MKNKLSHWPIFINESLRAVDCSSFVNSIRKRNEKLKIMAKANILPSGQILVLNLNIPKRRIAIVKYPTAS